MHRRSFFALALAGLTGALAGVREPKWWRLIFDGGVQGEISVRLELKY